MACARKSGGNCPSSSKAPKNWKKSGMPSLQNSHEDWADRFFRDLARDSTRSNPPPTLPDNEDVLLGRLAVERGLVKPDDLEACLGELKRSVNQGEKVS